MQETTCQPICVELFNFQNQLQMKDTCPAFKNQMFRLNFSQIFGDINLISFLQISVIHFVVLFFSSNLYHSANIEKPFKPLRKYSLN